MSAEGASEIAKKMSAAKQKEVELPGGFIVEGKLIRRIVIREMMDTEEELLADKDAVLNLVLQCITRIGESIIEPSMISSIFRSQCLYGDWEVILFELRRLTVGFNYLFTYICPNDECKTENKDEKVDLRTVKIRPFIEPNSLTRGFSYTSRDGTVFNFRDRMWYDVDAISQIMAQKNKKLLAELLSVGLVSIVIDGVTEVIKSDIWQEHVTRGVELLAKYMPTYNDREQVRSIMNARAKFGVIRDVFSTCKHCGTNASHRFNVDVSFLFPSIAELGISKSD